MSGESDQDYFADGLTEDIITALSLFRSIPVIARNSTFGYKGQTPDVRDIGTELGAQYVLEVDQIRQRRRASAHRAGQLANGCALWMVASRPGTKSSNRAEP